ncbi:MAG TPA: hypothetical protein VE596_05400 [Gaiellaceae bacterium]|jgi:hypothetical protein|nr:hypothetical protein [Gaiellaceae bacterium]
MNENAGVLTAAGFVVALFSALLVWQVQIRGRRTFRILFFEALYEAFHNLYHLGRAYEGKHQLQQWPEYELRYARRLLDEPYVDLLNPRLRSSLDHILRNDTYIRQVPHTKAGLASSARNIGYLCEHMMRFLLDAIREQEFEAVVLFDYFANNERERLSEWIDIVEPRKLESYRFRLDAEDATAQEAKQHLFWFKGSKPSRLYAQLVSLDDPPPRPPRPSRWAYLGFRLRVRRTSLRRVGLQRPKTHPELRAS